MKVQVYAPFVHSLPNYGRKKHSSLLCITGFRKKHSYSVVKLLLPKPRERHKQDSTLGLFFIIH